MPLHGPEDAMNDLHNRLVGVRKDKVPEPIPLELYYMKARFFEI